ncbi:hypothetical protein ALI144C_10305 [Actinosynnema sp. ALI-1.44]|uniref:hypothetical protein n=1 Tax=Actinosynnema sp. ALI-1.44 TaxID=1933779 RepID=UPI00097BFBFA|nr:hypothetical protein [Actinosynnema sp. ALI-1.44]ONI87020.1 hypothetical protein ALI144C_10305 [Actinosynnema sp. ALI-1.44]
MKKLLSVLVGALAAGVVAYVKGGDAGAAALIGLAFAVPIGINALVLPGWGTLAPAAAFVGLMAVFGPDSAAIRDWVWLWLCLAFAAVVVSIWTWIDMRRRRKS